MAGRSVDVSLRIKAQDEASKALDAVGKALKDLGGAQAALAGGSSGVGKFVESLSKNVDGLSTLFKKLDTTLAGTNRAYESQARQLASVNSSIIDRKRRIEELTKAEADLQRIQGSYKTISPAKQASFVGPVPPRLTQVRTQLGTETNTLAKEEASLTRLIGKIAEARDANQQIRSVQGQVATAINTTTTAFIEQANALDRLSASEKRAAQDAVSRQQNQALANRVAAVTGTGRTGTPESLRSQRQIDLEKTFAPVFAAEDAAALKGSAQTFDPLQASAKEAAAAMQQIQKYARDVAESLDPVARVTRKVAEEQTRLSAAVNIGALSQSQAATALQKYKQNLEGTANTTDKQGREFEELSNYVDEMRRDFDRAGYAQAFLTRETAKLDRALKLNIIDMNQYGKALESVKRKSEQLGDKSNPSILGLNPYQTQNLMFQFNDIATQLASGSSITQTLAQQGGQILQLFPKVGNAMIGAFTGAGPYAAALAVVIGGVVLAIKSAADQAERIRSLGGLLTAIGTEGGSSVKALSDAATALDRYGMSAEEALTSTRRLTREGFDASKIVQFGKTAKDMSDVLGIDLNQAVGLLTDAYGGNLESLRRLMDETDAFTPAQREVIETMYSSGDAAGALDKAFGILSKNLGEGAKQARGPWAEAFRNLSNAWDELVKGLGDTYLAKDALDTINQLATALDWLTGSSKAAREAEEKRLAVYGKDNPLTEDQWRSVMQENNLLPKGASGTQTAPGKTDKEPVATAEQVNNAAKMTKEMQQQAILAKKVTSEAVIQEKLRVVGEQFNTEYGNKLTPGELARLRELKLVEERKKLEEQLGAYQEQQARKREQEQKKENTGLFQAMALLRNKEGFISKAKYDENAYRVGYGSDTVTGLDGSVQRVTSTTTTDKAGAERDLERRAGELIDVIKKRIGAERFGDFSAKQQGAIVSLYYNYGKNADRIKKDLEPLLESGTNEQIAAMVRSFANDKPRTKNGKAVNYDRRMAEADILGQPNASVAEGAAEFIDDATTAQEKFNNELDAENDKRNRNYENQKALIGLQGEALINEQRRQAQLDAIAVKEAEIKRINEQRVSENKAPIAELSVADKAEIADSTGKLFDLQIPQAQFETLKKQLSDLEAYKATLQANLEQAATENDVGGMRKIQEDIDGVDARLKSAADSMLAFLSIPGNSEALGLYGVELDNMIAKFSQLSQKTAEWKLEVGSATISASEFANAFTSSAVSALDQFAQAIANGKNAFSSLWDAFRQFAADFLIQIAQMIQKQIIFNLVSGLLKSLAGGLGGAAAAPANSLSGGFSNFNLSSLQFHKGGLVGGGGGEFRSISAAAFNGAARYHSGGIAGLKPNEVPAVLMRGEEVLTRDDPRHMMNGGGGGAGGNVKIVNAFDVGDAVSKGMETRAGEKAILNLVRNNPRAFRAAMGNG